MHVNQPQELKWKTLKGELIPIEELSNIELKKFRKIAAKKSEDYYRKYEFFSTILEQMDEVVHNRLETAKKLVEELELTENEI